MIQALVDSLTDALLQELPPERAYDRAAFQTETLPEPVGHFLRRTLNEQVEREMARLHHARTNWVNYEAQDVQKAHDALVRAAGKHAQVPADEWEAVLHRAVRETGAYLVCPRSALARFVFSERETASAHHVLQRMRFFSPYSYFINVLNQYVERRNIEQMDAERFAEMLRRIDRQMTGDYTPAQWSRLLKPLFAFVDRAPAGPNGAVPASLLRAFFEEKQRADLAARFGRKQEALTREELRQLLNAEDQAEAFSAPASPKRSAEAPQQDVADDGPVPLWKQFQPRQRGNVPEKKNNQSSGGKRPPPEAPASGESVPRWKQFRGGEAPSSSSDPLRDLERNVLSGRGAKNRSFYVKNLFGGSRADYRDTLRQLRDVESWSEAQQVVAREVFRKHQVNIYSDAAVSFTDAVQQRFR